MAAEVRRDKTCPSPVELTAFVEKCRAMGLRSYAGDFVASDGTRVSCSFSFEREQRRSKDDDV